MGRRLVVMVVSMSFAALAGEPNAGVMPNTCPLDGTKFQTRAVLLGKQTGMRLDLKPIVDGTLESPLPRCPRCQYVGGAVDEGELPVVREVVASKDYTADPLVARSTHAARALIRARLDAPADELAFEWLHASWELEGEPELWRLATERALAAFAKSVLEIPSDDLEQTEARRTSQLMQVELLRRLGRFEEASSALVALAGLPEFKRGLYPTLVDTERELLTRKNAAPQPIPTIPKFDARDDDPAWIAARAAPGFRAFDAVFELERVDGSFIFTRSRAPRPLDSIRWSMPLEKGVPTKTWNDLLAEHQRVEAVVRKNPWLAEWKRASPERHVELILGSRFDSLDFPAWKASGFEGPPAARLLLREGDDAVVTLLLAAQGGAIVTDADDQPTRVRGVPTRERKAHWLTAKRLSYDPRGEPPEFMQITADGRFELRQTRQFTLEELDGLELEFEQYMQEVAR